MGRRGNKAYRGYYAPCPRCGQSVVHYGNGTIAHQHWYSEKCRNAGKKAKVRDGE